MNKVILMGRLTRDPDIRYTQGDNSMCIARYTLAVDRRFNRNNNDGNSADFIPCVVFGRSAEFTEKYLKKGTKMAIVGRIQTGSYTNKDGDAASGNGFGGNYGGNGGNYGGNGGSYNGGNNYNNNGGNYGGGYNAGANQAPQNSGSAASSADSLDGFMNIPDGIDEELPFA